MSATSSPGKGGSLVREVFKIGWRELFNAAVISMFMNLLALTLPLYMLQVFVHVLPSQSEPTLFFVTLIAVAAQVVWGILSELRSRVLRLLGEKIDVVLGERVQRAMIAHATANNDMRTASGLKDLATVRSSVGSGQTAAVFDVPWTPLFLIVVYLLNPVLGSIATGGAVILLGLAWFNDKWTRGPELQAGRSAEKELAFSLSSIRNAEVVEGMGMRGAVVERWHRQHVQSLALQAKSFLRGSIVSNTSRSIRFILQIVIMGAGAYLVISQKAGIGAMMAAVYLLSRALAPIDVAIGMWRQLVAAQGSYNRLDGLLDAERARPRGLRLPRPDGRLTVHNLVFGRPGLPPVLKGVSFAAAPGEIVGIVGPSAAGKSTLAKLIVGVWRPSSGVVRLDGGDVTNWDPDELGGHLGYLPQEVELFAGTIRDNIGRLRAADDMEIVAAGKLAGAHDLILKLPKGYDTEIGEAGSILSGGQRQRIALARALFGNPCLVVLDEPNANLDGAGEDALIAAVKRAKLAGCTIILITHKPALLFIVDKILVLNEGIAEAFGERNAILPKIMPSPPKRAVTRVKSDQQAGGADAKRG